MKEYILFIRTDGDHLDSLSPEEQQKHVQKAAEYIDRLSKTNKLKGAQPLEFKGALIASRNGKVKDGPFNESKEVIMGYFHISADDLNEAVEIAKAHPILKETDAKIEVREIRHLEGIN
ncbi:MAG TPA: YciI family protein [Ignavibacteriaceae bacterium]|nr:YciI family protein [Ignavibacteriaceae bacterium]